MAEGAPTWKVQSETLRNAMSQVDWEPDWLTGTVRVNGGPIIGGPRQGGAVEGSGTRWGVVGGGGERWGDAEGAGERE